MVFSKAYDCLPHDLVVAKVEAYGLSKIINLDVFQKKAKSKDSKDSLQSTKLLSLICQVFKLLSKMKKKHKNKKSR